MHSLGVKLEGNQATAMDNFLPFLSLADDGLEAFYRGFYGVQAGENAGVLPYYECFHDGAYVFANTVE